MASLADPHQDHRAVVESLPDYAIGALSDAELDDVARILETCAACRRELRHVLEMVGALSDQPPPSASTRETLLERARAGRVQPMLSVMAPSPTLPPSPAGAGASSRPTPIRPWWKTQGPIAAALAAALLLLAYGLSTFRTELPGSHEAVIAGIVAEAPFYPLTDSQLSPPATGVLFAAGDAMRAVLLADGLPPLPSPQRYQVWLFDSDGARTSAGLFAPDANGRAEVLIETERPLSGFAAVAVSAEPAAGSQEPTSPLALGGWIGPAPDPTP